MKLSDDNTEMQKDHLYFHEVRRTVQNTFYSISQEVLEESFFKENTMETAIEAIKETFLPQIQTLNA